MSPKETYITDQGHRLLKKELEHLTTVRRREVAARIHGASEEGTVDNAEYEDAKNEQAFLEGKISELESTLSRAVVPSAEVASSGAVSFGSSVRVETEQGKKRLYKIVGSAEADPLDGNISVESPVGRALMGHNTGDQVQVETPSGLVRLTIIKIT
tara:strand:+ start:76 stop:543 length:468 start_codon:yes stop_codon:yes gene_type:complete